MTSFARALRFFRVSPRKTLAFRAEASIHVVFLTKAAGLQVWASVHAGGAAFFIDHGLRTGLGWNNEKDATSYLSVKSENSIPQKPQIISPAPLRSGVSHTRLPLAQHACFWNPFPAFYIFFFWSQVDQMIPDICSIRPHRSLVGTEFLLAEKGFLITRVIEEETRNHVHSV